jgi:cytochrome c556
MSGGKSSVVVQAATWSIVLGVIGLAGAGIAQALGRLTPPTEVLTPPSETNQPRTSENRDSVRARSVTPTPGKPLLFSERMHRIGELFEPVEQAAEASMLAQAARDAEAESPNFATRADEIAEQLFTLWEKELASHPGDHADRMLRASEKARELARMLRESPSDGNVQEMLASLARSCKECHQRYRD